MAWMMRYLVICRLVSPSLPEPLKPQLAIPIQPIPPPPPPSQKMQEPMVPFTSNPASQTIPAQNLDAPPQPPPRSRSSQNLPSEPVSTQQQVRENGINNGVQLEARFSRSPFEDPTFNLLPTPMIPTSASPVPTFKQLELAAIPPTTQNNVNALNGKRVLPAIPLNAAKSRSQENITGSKNPFVSEVSTEFAGLNPFAGSVSTVNPFKTQELKASTQLSVDVTVSDRHFNAGLALGSVDPLMDRLSFQNKTAVFETTNPKGWVTFDDQDVNANIKPPANISEFSGHSSTKPARLPELSSTQIDMFPTSNFGFDNDWSIPSTYSKTLPARRPPPIPSRSRTSTRSPTKSSNSFGLKYSPTQEYTDR